MLIKAKRNREKMVAQRAAAAMDRIRSQRKGMSISQVIRWCQRYEERTGRYISYGKPVPLIEAEQRAKAGEKRRKDPRR